MTGCGSTDHLHQWFQTVYLFLTLVVGNMTVRLSQSAKYLGVTVGMHFSMTAPVVNLIRTLNFELCHMNSIRHYLAVQTIKTLASAFVLSRLDTKTIQPSWSWKLLRLTTLHLIFTLCTGFKLMLESDTKFVHFLISAGPVFFLLDLLKIYTPSRNSDLLQTTVYCAFHLSTLSHMMSAPSFTLLQHSGTLPQDIRFSPSASSFRSALKTHLFQQSHSTGQLIRVVCV